ncbi:MAG: phosphocholine cytidylyltransferase family protein [Gemmatimonadaceae bacterium]|nr:phosphocholine cytidylyltransferase family protein [Gemmatimonadaceae bacterium]
MQGVILAAGVGSRLTALSGGTPKCLVEIGGRPLIMHQLEMLADHGVGPTIVVVGYRADEVKAVIGERAQIVVNERYAETNSLYSLWLARDLIKGPFVLLNSDLFFDPTILNKLLREKGSALAYDSTSSRGREQTKVALRKGFVSDLGKAIPPSVARGESLGLLKFDDEGARAILEAADHLLSAGHEDAWVIEGTRAVVSQHEVTAVNIAGLPWAEIDFPYDLDVARREVWPAIYKRRWRKSVYWNRTRWVALAAAALVLGIIGWQANTRVGPASMDWETIAVQGDSIVLVRSKGPESKPQRWAMVPLGKSAHGTATATRVSVETRLVLSNGSRSEYRYVIAITVDGEPVTWKSHSTKPDTLATSPVGRVGKRERTKLDLAPGAHEIGVRLLDGHGERILVRLREREELGEEP